MNPNIIYTLLLAIVFLALFGSAELLYHRYHFKAEVTRKYVHVTTGVLTLLFPVLIQNKWLVLFLCGSFLVILLFSLFFKLLPSINAVNRKTRGSILYPVIVYTCYLFQAEYGLVFYYIPILILAFCDPVAALVGKKWPKGAYKTFGQTKTMSGSMSFFISAVVIAVLLLFFVEKIHFLPSLTIATLIALTTATAEALTHKGYDNLTIPGTVVLVLWTLETYQIF